MTTNLGSVGPTTPSLHNHKAIIGILVLLVIVGLGLFGYLRYPSLFNQAGMSKNLQDYQSGKAKIISGDYDQAIQDFNSILDSAPDKALEGKTKILLGSTYLRRSQPGDEARGMLLYKDVVSDYTVPAKVRALALDTIARIVRRNSLSFYQLYFPEEPYSTYTPKTGDEVAKVTEVYFKLLSLSDTTYPNSYAKYSIAGNYYSPLMGRLLATGTSSKGDATLIAAAKAAQTYVGDGDALLDTDQYTPTFLIDSYFYRALAISTSQGVLDIMPLAEREKAYTLIFDTVDANPGIEKDSRVSIILAEARFFYADFLMKYIGTSRNEDIRHILKPFANETFIISHSAYVRQAATGLAKISPEFNTYLVAHP